MPGLTVLRKSSWARAVCLTAGKGLLFSCAQGHWIIFSAAFSICFLFFRDVLLL
jgi:hypothetical protein